MMQTLKVRSIGSTRHCKSQCVRNDNHGKRFARITTRDTPSTAVASTSSTSLQEEASAVVDKVLSMIKNTDSGMALSKDQKIAVDQLLNELEVLGKQQQPRPNVNPLLWGNYEVVYTSTKDKGEPAGGRFRGGVGRALFKTKGLFQSALEPDVCCNKVEFRLFGVLDGFVGLRGKILPVDDGNLDTVRVLFDPTVLSFGPLHLKLGRPSEVVLTTTYLDDRVRLGKGSRGSLFVFTRGGTADTAEMEKVGLERTNKQTLALATAGYLATMLGAVALFMAVHNPIVRGFASLVLVLGALIGAVLKNGGSVENDYGAQRRIESDKMRAEQAARQAQQAQQTQSPPAA